MDGLDTGRTTEEAAGTDGTTWVVCGAAGAGIGGAIVIVRDAADAGTDGTTDVVCGAAFKMFSAGSPRSRLMRDSRVS